MLKNFYRLIVKYRIIVFIAFIAAAIAGAMLRSLVGVNYDMKDYLPEDSPSTQGLHVMQEEFGGNMPNTRVMISNVTYQEALEYKQKLEDIDGVDQVMWLDDQLYLDGAPPSFAGQDTLDTYFKDGNALMIVTVDKDKRLKAVSEIRKTIGDDNCMSGDAVSTAEATVLTVKEIKKIAMFSVLLVLLILILTTRSWLEPIIILAGIGVAILINNGSNLIFGEISFVTNASGSILQLAVSLDYSVFLIHRFEECRKELEAEQGEHARGKLDIKTAENAMVDALLKCTGPITSSGLTTVIGFLALILMQYRIGPDMGLALAKGVAISLITVLTFTPAMILIMLKLTEATRHRNFIPDFTAFGKVVRKVMIPAVVVFIIILVPAFLISHNGDFYFGASHIFGPKTRVGMETNKIKQVFGTSDTYAVIVPKGDSAREEELTEKLEEYPEIKGIRSYNEILGVIPPDIAPDSISGLLVSDKYSRIVLTVDAEYEGEKTFNLVKSLRKTCKSVYGDDYYLVGEGVSTYDLMDTITSDMLKINLSAVLAIYLILVLMFRKLFLPLLLVASIEAAIWINLAIPTILGQSVFYIGYLIISSVQLGATVDYAILFTDRYRENRATLERSESVIETIRNVTASILTSGSALIIVGFLMGFLSTHGILAQLGFFIGRGAICSLIIVFFVLPGLLFLYDRFVLKNVKKLEQKLKS